MTSLTSAHVSTPLDGLAAFRHLLAVAVAVLRNDGQLVDCNVGFRRLVNVDGADAENCNVAAFFILPRFDLLAGALAAPGQLVYRGVLHIGNDERAYRSLIGTVHRDGEHLILTAGFDAAESEQVHSQVVRLNEELAETRRELARGKHHLLREIAQRKLIEAAEAASLAFLDKAAIMGGVGGWNVNLLTRTLQWTDQTCRILDVELGHRPTLKDGFQCFAPEARAVLVEAVQNISPRAATTCACTPREAEAGASARSKTPQSRSSKRSSRMEYSVLRWGTGLDDMSTDTEE